MKNYSRIYFSGVDRLHKAQTEVKLGVYYTCLFNAFQIRTRIRTRIRTQNFGSTKMTVRETVGVNPRSYLELP